jgi:hypothetical protein
MEVTQQPVSTWKNIARKPRLDLLNYFIMPHISEDLG